MAVSLVELGAMFVALGVAGAAASKIGLSVIPLYVVSGMLVGPTAATLFGEAVVTVNDVVTGLAELGIVLLLFFLGLEFSLERLLASKTKITRAGVVDLVVNFPLGVVIGLAFGWSVVEALLFGGVVYVSSSAIVTKSLLDLGWIANPESESILGTLVFEDLFVAVYLAVVSSLVLGGEGVSGTARSVGVALGFLVVLFLVVYYGTRWFRSVLDVGPDEQFVIRVLGVTVPIAGVALALGVSEAVAAFFVGMGFAATPHHGRIERLLTPVRDTFAAVFFFWIGLNTDPRLLAGVAGILAVAVVATAPAKVVSGFFGGRAYALDDRRSLRVGLGLVARGEFSLVIAATAAAGTGPVMTEVIPAVAVGYVLVMSILGTVLMQHAGRVEGLVARAVPGWGTG